MYYPLLEGTLAYNQWQLHHIMVKKRSTNQVFLKVIKLLNVSHIQNRILNNQLYLIFNIYHSKNGSFKTLIESYMKYNCQE